MDYISEIFSRLNFQQIREFLMHGVECVRINPKGYKERLDDAKKPLCSVIAQHFSEPDEYEEIMNKVYDYGGEIQEVYMEIGLQCGLVLGMQMLNQIGDNRGSEHE